MGRDGGTGGRGGGYAPSQGSTSEPKQLWRKEVPERLCSYGRRQYQKGTAPLFLVHPYRHQYRAATAGTTKPISVPYPRQYSSLWPVQLYPCQYRCHPMAQSVPGIA
eukprot:2485757-Rhodomonas_salina.1